MQIAINKYDDLVLLSRRFPLREKGGLDNVREEHVGQPEETEKEGECDDEVGAEFVEGRGRDEEGVRD